MDAAAPAATLIAPPRYERRSLIIVSIAHWFSHFYMLVIPPLFPLLYGDLGVSWFMLGVLFAAYSVGTAVVQVPVGLWVDRMGARPILLLGFLVQAVAFGLCGVFASYWPMFLLLIVAGFGNAVFHPADYAILAAHIRKERHGRAFGVHLFASFLGWGAGYAIMPELASHVGWQNALIAVGLLGVLYMIPLWWAGDALDDRVGPNRDKGKAGQSGKDRLALLKSPVIILLFMFFAFISLASNGLQAFTVVSLNLLHGYSHHVGNWALSVYLFSGGAGVLVGGWLADRLKNHELATAISYAASAAVVLIAALIEMPPLAMIVLFGIGGFLVAVVSPIRDLIVRQKSPPGAIGTVFAIVTLGFSVGIGSLPVFGWFNDIGAPHLLFWCNAALLAGAVASVYIVRNARA